MTVGSVIKGKFFNLWRDQRTYKNKAYAEKVMNEREEWVHEELEVREVEVDSCPRCNQALNNGVSL
jgi:hypothetical protein